MCLFLAISYTWGQDIHSGLTKPVLQDTTVFLELHHILGISDVDYPRIMSKFCNTKSVDIFLSYSHLPTLETNKQFPIQCQHADNFIKQETDLLFKYILRHCLLSYTLSKVKNFLFSKTS